MNIPNSPYVYTWRFKARTYELDLNGVVKPAVYLNYMEEVATQVSAALGWDFNWYATNKRLWVARKHVIRILDTIGRGEELEAITWVADARRVQSNREYVIRRISDEQPVLHARTNWVFLNEETMRPERIPSNVDHFIAGVGEANLDTEVDEAITVEKAFIYTENRRVEYHEVDSAGHVNNAIYVTWAEEAIRNMLSACGWTPNRLKTADFQMRLHAREIEYFRSTLYDESVQINTRLAQIGKDRAAWITEMYKLGTEELLVKDVCVRAFTDATGSRSIPDEMLLSLKES